MAAGDLVKEVVFRKAHVLGDKPLLSSLTDNELTKEIDAAIREYSLDAPYRAVSELETTDVTDREYALSIANIGFTWDRRTDSVLEIENPRDQMPKIILNEQNGDFVVSEKTTGVFVIRFYINPSEWRLTLTRQWTLALVELDTVAIQHVGTNAAAKAARIKAARYSDTDDPTNAADVTDYKGKGGDWLNLADALDLEYQKALNRPAETKAGGSSILGVDLDMTFQGSRRRSYLVHRPRRR
jgi:hypothetical protein